MSVFPSPGSAAALPGTQISFRGLPAGQIGSVQVVGSRTGPHSGRIAPDSDGLGGSFLPDTPFAPGETVTVTTALNILNGEAGSFRFQVVTPADPIGPEQIPLVPAGAHGLQHFRSAPRLLPPTITVTKRGAPAALGDIFVAPQQGPLQNGPLLLAPSGKLIWFHPLPKNMLATDFRVQRLWGQSVLTWWQGATNHGSGRGEGIIYDHHYHQLAVVRAANGLQGADLHEFLVTPQGQAYIVAASPVLKPGIAKPLMDSVVQEIDIRTGLVLFEWHALDHIPLRASFFTPRTPGFVFDPFHLNSISLTGDGNLVVSLRNTWGIYKINHQSGAVMWTLGSDQNQFRRGPRVKTAFQHDVVAHPDGTFTIFDDGAGPPTIHRESRAIRIQVDVKKRTARLLKQYEHVPPLVSNFEGGAQPLGGGEMFVGWGQQPYFSEFNRAGALDFDARFTAPTDSYRAYRFRWSGQPLSPPALAVGRVRRARRLLFASWNGATDVAFWRVLAGARPTSLSAIITVRKRGFETAIGVRRRARYFAVQALGPSHRVLSTSAAILAKPQ